MDSDLSLEKTCGVGWGGGGRWKVVLGLSVFFVGFL